jgi:hypothetical protein
MLDGTRMMLKFSHANAKIEALKDVPDIAKYLEGNRKVYSLDLLSGWSCPYAKDCKSKVHLIDGARKVVDGPEVKFRCFSASQEALFPAVYNSRKYNYDLIKNSDNIFELINRSMPKNLGILRFHVGGDFFNEKYFCAAIETAKQNPEKLFYFYTKSLSFWVKHKAEVDMLDNLVPTASYGGRLDHLIKEYKLRSSKVIFTEKEAGKLKIDHTDECAANPKLKKKDFALLIHGTQPANTEASKALQVLKKNKVKHSYAR